MSECHLTMKWASATLVLDAGKPSLDKTMLVFVQNPDSRKPICLRAPHGARASFLKSYTLLGEPQE